MFRRGALSILCFWPVTAWGASSATNDWITDAYVIEHAAPVVRDVKQLSPSREKGFDAQGWGLAEILTPTQRGTKFSALTHLILDVTTAGRVANCEIFTSKLSAEQDERLCHLMVERAKFPLRYEVPGTPVGWKANYTIRWLTGPLAQMRPPVMSVRLAGPAEITQSSWPRLTAKTMLVVTDFASMRQNLPRDVRARHPTSLDLIVAAKSGITDCLIGESSGDAKLDALACTVAKALPLQFIEPQDENRSANLPLQFVWRGEKSHIRVPLPSKFDRVLPNFDPLDPRDRQLRHDPLEVAVLTPLPAAMDFSRLFQPGEEKAYLWFDVTIDATGKVTGCRSTETGGRARFVRPACDEIRRMRFRPTRDIFGNDVAAKRFLQFVISPAGISLRDRP